MNFRSGQIVKVKNQNRMGLLKTLNASIWTVLTDKGLELFKEEDFEFYDMNHERKKILEYFKSMDLESFKHFSGSCNNCYERLKEIEDLLRR